VGDDPGGDLDELVFIDRAFDQHHKTGARPARRRVAGIDNGSHPRRRQQQRGFGHLPAALGLDVVQVVQADHQQSALVIEAFAAADQAIQAQAGDPLMDQAGQRVGLLAPGSLHGDIAQVAGAAGDDGPHQRHGNDRADLGGIRHDPVGVDDHTTFPQHLDGAADQGGHQRPAHRRAVAVAAAGRCHQRPDGQGHNHGKQAIAGATGRFRAKQMGDAQTDHRRHHHRPQRQRIGPAAGVLIRHGHQQPQQRQIQRRDRHGLRQVGQPRVLGPQKFLGQAEGDQLETERRRGQRQGRRQHPIPTDIAEQGHQPQGQQAEPDQQAHGVRITLQPALVVHHRLRTPAQLQRQFGLGTENHHGRGGLGKYPHDGNAPGQIRWSTRIAGARPLGGHQALG
jgi:hypothetical protein